MSIITTPAQAIEIDDLSLTQRETIKNSLGLADFPYQPDKTYIIFDAAIGSNDLHIITGASNSYSINKGDGTQPTDYTDAGGTKALTYAVAGRYMITIDGTFNGISTSGASPADKQKYIEVIAGTNYPTTIPTDAFKACTKLINIDFEDVTAIGDGAFDNCVKLEVVSLYSAITIGDTAFNECEKLYIIHIPAATTIGDEAFSSCVALNYADLRLVTTIGSSSFAGCLSLIDVYLRSVTSIGSFAFDSCNFILLRIKYTSGLTVGTGAFTSVKLSDLYPIGATNGTEAAAVETKVLAAGATQLNGYRLLY